MSRISVYACIRHKIRYQYVGTRIYDVYHHRSSIQQCQCVVCYEERVSLVLIQNYSIRIRVNNPKTKKRVESRRGKPICRTGNSNRAYSLTFKCVLTSPPLTPVFLGV